MHPAGKRFPETPGNPGEAGTKRASTHPMRGANPKTADPKHPRCRGEKMNTLVRVDLQAPGFAGATLTTGRSGAAERPTRAEAEQAVRTLIRWAGDNPTREGLIETPARVVRAYQQWFAGYQQDPAEHLRRTFAE